MEYSKSLKLNHIFRRLYSTGGKGNAYLVLYARRNRLGKRILPAKWGKLAVLPEVEYGTDG